MDDQQKTVFWQRVMLLVETLESCGTSEECESQLLAIEEGFDRAFDPVDTFPEFLTVLLCKALRKRPTPGPDRQ